MTFFIQISRRGEHILQSEPALGFFSDECEAISELFSTALCEWIEYSKDLDLVCQQSGITRMFFRMCRWWSLKTGASIEDRDLALVHPRHEDDLEDHGTGCMTYYGEKLESDDIKCQLHNIGVGRSSGLIQFVWPSSIHLEVAYPYGSNSRGCSISLIHIPDIVL